jgi:hypothetical protein
LMNRAGLQDIIFAKGIMTEHNLYLNKLLAGGEFHFANLEVQSIDNAPIYDLFGRTMSDQECCLFHRDVPSGDDYMGLLHENLNRALNQRKSLPIVRFADGEYAYYSLDLHCNGLYQQAESIAAIQKMMPHHTEALKKVASTGFLAPLVYPGNIGPEKKAKGIFSFLRKRKTEPSAGIFLDFISQQGIELTGSNYIPFYIIYAYLTSGDFARLVHGKKICILNSDWNQEACARWFARFSSRPELVFVRIPDAYIATRWPAMKEEILQKIPADTDLCLVGAGVGALLVCSDTAGYLSVPAIDAGHVLNMMNDLINKSNGQRLYTLRGHDPLTAS